MTELAAVSVYVLDVGQGDCTFVLSADPRDGAILFDCNDPYVAERFVIDHGIKTLHAVVVSHLDADHIRGMVPFLEAFLTRGGTVQHIFLGKDRDRARLGKAGAELMDFALERRKAAGFQLHVPQREDVPRSVWRTPTWSASLLLPRYDALLEAWVDQEDQPNAHSVALRVECGRAVVLIGGDVPLASWELAEPALLPAAAIRAPHHGGGIRDGAPKWGEADLYDRVAPNVVLLSVGTNNGHGHPTDEHLAGIAPAKRRLLCTQITPRCHDDIPGIRSELLRTASRVSYSPYRHRLLAGTSGPARPRNEAPCASSMLVELRPDGRVSVDPEPLGWHDRQIGDLKLTSPRCRSR